MCPNRLLPLARQPLLPPLDRLDARRAATPLARLRGLAGIAPDEVAATTALLLPRTRSIHTFAMRFPLDLVWIGHDGRAVRIDAAVPPRRLRACARAAEVLELPAGTALVARLRPGAPVR
ncbi:DUF192 domain-containing protein [Conexibacter arvalis]|uniref:DUF192 domain-containing protein n=1 Tax=Conexibacter arvalis TaxID=912552 RepID=A0A840IF04_9ACTN|nr:DUF192 domain-containing protein [Conexibacter arvalis]MBB4662578.1 hypothetical protein [Conexibacter arvalis]